MLPRLLTEKEVAEALQIKTVALARLVKLGAFPAGAKFGNSRRWDPATVEKFLAEKLSTAS